MGKRKNSGNLPPAKKLKLSLDSFPLEVLKMIADRVVDSLRVKTKIKKVSKWPHWFPYLGRIVHHTNLVYKNVETCLFGSMTSGYKISSIYNVADILTIRNYHQFSKVKGFQYSHHHLTRSLSKVKYIFSTLKIKKFAAKKRNKRLYQS